MRKKEANFDLYFRFHTKDEYNNLPNDQNNELREYYNLLEDKGIWRKLSDVSDNTYEGGNICRKKLNTIIDEVLADETKEVGLCTYILSIVNLKSTSSDKTETINASMVSSSHTEESLQPPPKKITSTLVTVSEGDYH